ncbi:MAG: hypothetical protein LBB79_03830 [Prevotellaceae bacterium]|nr:hypothetical protein [Prevotellaceae bacterium]
MVRWEIPRSARNDGGSGTAALAAGRRDGTTRRGGGTERRREGGTALAALTAIPLGMERSVEKHPCHQTRHSVGMSPEYFWTHS